MKLLLVTPDLFRSEGGIARIMRSYLRALAGLAKTGDTVGCCTLLDDGDTRDQARRFAGAVLGRVDNAAGRRPVFSATVFRRALDADLVVCGHLHFLSLIWLASLLSRRVRYCVVAHGIEVWRPYTWLELRALRGADRILCISEYTRRQMLRFAPALDADRLLVVPNTYDPAFEPDGSGAARRPAASTDSPRMLVVSRLVTSDPYKGVDTVIEAMPLILSRRPGVELRIVGGGDDRPRLEELARAHGVSSAVNFLGTIDDSALRCEYRDCDLFALPSRKEGFGLVYLEAMSHGKPCLAARAGGAPEVVDRQVGELVEYGNVAQIASAVDDLILHPRDPEVIRSRAASFSFPRFQSRLAEALQPLLTGRTHGDPPEVA